MNDAFGNELKIGDKIVYVSGFSLTSGVIDKISDKYHYCITKDTELMLFSHEIYVINGAIK